MADRASLVTHISKEGQAVTDARYFVKSRGNPNFRVTLPEGTELWSATVNDAPVVPVSDEKSILIPLPQHADPDTVLTLDLKVAAHFVRAGAGDHRRAHRGRAGDAGGMEARTGSKASG